MIISDEHRYVFVEIPHTGSHSIAEQLMTHYGGKPILRKHANVTQFLGQASKAQKTYFKFATVRNPLDASATDYEKLRNNHKEQFTRPDKLIENGGHVTEEHLKEFRFVKDNEADFAAFFRRFRGKLYNNWFLVGDQYFDFVIRFEALQDGFAEVLKRLGIPQVEPIPHVNKTKGKDRLFTDYYSPEVRDLAVAVYGPFMKKWGYSFPDAWGAVHVPWRTRLQFSAVDGMAKLASSCLTLDPDRPVVHTVKRRLDRITRQKA